MYNLINYKWPSAVVLSRKYNNERTEKAIEKAGELFNSDKEGLARVIEIPALYYYSIKAIYSDFLEIKRKKAILSKEFSIPKQEITGDLATFISSNGEYKAYVDDLQYDITTSKKVIKNLEIVWGNLHLEKLDDFSKLESLKIVIGDVYTMKGKNAETLTNITTVTGNIYSEDNSIIDYAKNITYIGGDIYNTRTGEKVKINKKDK